MRRLALLLWIYCAVVALVGISCSEAWAFRINIHTDSTTGADPTCPAGYGSITYREDLDKWRKCENGAWTDLDTGGGGGETNTASNLGGGLANYSTKVGVDLQFNSFNATRFALAANVLDVVDVNCTGCLGATEIAALDAGDTTTGTFADAIVDGSLESDEVVPTLAGDVDGASNANDLDEAAVEGG